MLICVWVVAQIGSACASGCLKKTVIYAHRYNSDFALEWPRPLPPNVQLVGALLPRPARPLPPHFQVPILSSHVCL